MAKNVTVTPADGDIQFENTSGTAAGRIEQNGDDLVISNAVGDILFGDIDSDVYIGDGVNSVDVLFEVSGAIKADPDSQGVTLTLGGAETDLQLYAPSMSNLSAQGSESTTLMINTNGEIGTRELGSAAFSNTSAFATSSHSHSNATTSAAGFMSSTDKTKLDGIASNATANAGTVTSVGITPGTGLDQSGGPITTSGNITLNLDLSEITLGAGLDSTATSLSLDLSELTDMTASVNTSQDELILLDNGAERRKLFSEIFGSAAYNNSSAFISASSADTASQLITFSKGISSDGNSKFYNWRALDNSSNSGNFYWHIGTITGSQSTRFMVTIAGRSTSYSDNSLPAMGHIVGQLNNDNNYDIVFYNHSTASSEVVSEVGIVDDGTDSVHLYVKTGDYAELTATAHISDGTITTNSNSSADGTSSAPDQYATVTEYTSYNSGNLTAGQNVSISSGVIASSHPAIGQTAGTYGNTANGTKIDTITIDENGHVTNIATGATGNMTGFFVEDGDGTEVQIVNAREWKFVEGTGIDINWTDTSTGNDSDPYDLTFAIKNNSIGIDQLNVSDGTNGQVLTTNGSGTLSFSTVTSGTSYGWTLGGTDIESGDEIALGGGLSLSGTGGSYTLTSANDNTTYTAGTGLTLTGTEFSVTANTYATAAQGTTADAALPKAGGTMTGDLTVSSGTNGDSKIIIESDTDNSNEDDNPQLHFKQDGGLVNAYAGLVGTGGNIFTDSITNAAYFGITNDAALQLFTNNTSRLTINGNGTVSLDAYGAGILKTNANGLISLDTSTYLTAHPSISAATSVNNSGRTYIQDITLDSNGHITAITSATETVTNTNTQLSDAEVRAAVDAASDSNVFTDADHTKLDGIEANATADQTAAQIRTALGTGNNGVIPSAGSAGQFLKHDGTFGTPSYTTNTNTTYSAGSGLDLTSTTFSVEADLRDGITHVGKDTSNYIQFDPTNGRIDFYAGGTFVARLESDGDLHVKGDVIAYSDIFS